ncbi:MAG: translational GTPase TypA [Methylibium sp.]|uniref:Large ribosomal subunit assembly factor BipA n=1 Tax=Methylibium petroleiphilum (strain ATCC BAA-1232 / LMG 22953 / PM1) TaxID=420662 RepID=A2SH37_METPP|nr:translational GTPase TypA [Methylibium petroleiphilum]ABM94876.1 putative GTP-binding elongation factor protein [Methylibium petroleiphilum PM1]MBN9203781.1 translational GTPase TypA [Methylibium petroleiphilum]
MTTSNNARQIRNVAIIAHVDHGKTTLVDQLLRQSGTFRENEKVAERVMDSNDIEKERGITILSKNCAVEWKGTHVNIVDTPGHADFGGEVERVLSMVDSVLLLVDAVEGPMPQTRFVTKKALALGLKPIVVVNKVDRPGARPDYVINATFDLFDKLGATEEQLDFPIIYASGLNGWASTTPGEVGTNMAPLFDAILQHVPPHEGDPEGPLQLQICSLDYSTFVGRIGIGRINQGTLKPMQDVAVFSGEDSIPFKARVNQVLKFDGLERVQATEAGPGDIVLINGIEDIGIGVTLTDIDDPVPLPMLEVDEPTLTMNFCVNNSPLAGREGKFVTSRQLRDRLDRELQSNVALRVKDTDEDGIFEVSGRGELHLTILLENMRREGYELAVSKPRVVFHEVNGERHEPMELVTADVEEQHQGGVMQALGLRKADLVNMEPDGMGRVRLEYRIPARGLIGFSNEFMNLTRGTGLISNIFDGYEPYKGELEGRKNGVLISQDDGEIVTYALGKLDDRGRMFVKAGDPVYEGMLVGIHSRDNDLVVNAVRAKQLTNFRVSGKEDAIKITPPIILSLEYAVEFIADDELVEITPKSIRLRKRHLKEHERKRASREAA